MNRECPCDAAKRVDPWCAAAGECVMQNEEDELSERRPDIKSCARSIYLADRLRNLATVTGYSASTVDHIRETMQLAAAEIERLTIDLRLAVFSDSEECKELTAQVELLADIKVAAIWLLSLGEGDERDEPSAKAKLREALAAELNYAKKQAGMQK